MVVYFIYLLVSYVGYILYIMYRPILQIGHFSGTKVNKYTQSSFLQKLNCVNLLVFLICSRQRNGNEDINNSNFNIQN
jgi:hypothetical protein